VKGPSTPGAAGAPAIPPGTFRIDREGLWRHEGQEVTHPGVRQNLFANLRADAEGHYLQVGPVRIPVEVDDAPFVVTRVEAPGRHGDRVQSLRIHLSDESEEALDPAALWLGRNHTPYCRVKSGRFTARFAVAAWLQLAEFIDEEPGTGDVTLVVAGRRVPIERRA
jgi:hypothetical protein